MRSSKVWGLLISMVVVGCGQVEADDVAARDSGTAADAGAPKPPPTPEPSPVQMCPPGFLPEHRACGPTGYIRGTSSTAAPARKAACAPAAGECSDAGGMGQPVATIKGSVIDCTGAPIVGAVVWTNMGQEDAGQCSVAATTDAAGLFVLNVPNGANYDFGFGFFDLYVETATRVLSVNLNDAYTCPTSACAIVVP